MTEKGQKELKSPEALIAEADRAVELTQGDKTPLAGFEQEDYVASTNFNARTLASLMEEFAAVRRATVQLCKHFTGEEWQRRGTANEREITTRAVVYNIAGHELHHVDALRSRYLVA